MTTGNFYEVTLFQTYLGEVMINRWDYQQVSGSLSDAAGLLSMFESVVLPDVAAIQSADVAYNRILVQNLHVPSDNAEDTTPTPAVGGQAGGGVPLPLALSFRSSRPDLSHRYSYKRFGGVASGLLSNAAFVTIGADVQSLEATMALQLSVGTSTWRPVQIKRVYPGGGAPPTLSINYAITGDWVASVNPTTQNTRKVGRGI